MSVSERKREAFQRAEKLIVVMERLPFVGDIEELRVLRVDGALGLGLRGEQAQV